MNTDINRRLGILVVLVVISILFLLPTFSPESFKNGSWLSRPISLGLDLRGGAHLVYQVKTEEAVKSKLAARGNAIKSELREKKIAVWRTKVNEASQLEIYLFSDRSIEEVKQNILDQYKDFALVTVSKDESGKSKLIYALNQGTADKIKEEAVDQSIETLRNRVDQFGVAEPLIQKSGSERVILQMPGVQDVESIKRVVGSVAKLEFRLLPTSGSSAQTMTLESRDKVPVVVEDELLMTGDVVSDARVALPDGQAEVSLTLTSEGSKLFRKITAENVGRNLSIILDGVVYSSPVIRETIAGGVASISGGFTMEEAKQLAVVLRSGALAAPLVVLEERTVGPSLGAESIRQGMIAVLAGFIAIVLFMLVYYKKSGAVAVVSLALNMFLMMAALAAFGATLTLPGIAGLALTIGMAVDSNVIIFERIRDELRNGSSRDAAVVGGFDKALWAILDSNITTLISGCVLYAFGTGTIRGFAVTLSIGILTTVFCATFVCRLAFDLLQLKSSKNAISI